MNVSTLTRPTAPRAAVAIGVLLVAVLIACNGVQSVPVAVKPNPPTPVTPIAPTPPPTVWLACAHEYAGCSFVGLRDVRYVLGGKVIATKSFFGGLESCNGGQMGIVDRDSLGDFGQALCEYTSTYKTATLQNPMPGMSGLGATVTVPLGNPGFTSARVKATDDSGVQSDIGSFRVPCGVSHFNFDDPMVHPGKPGASHLHMFFGNSDTNANSTADSLANSGASTCAGGTLDRTAYWVPALIDSSGNVIMPESEIFYYKTGYLGIKPSDVQAMPKGLRMISGNSASTQGEGHNWGCGDPYIGHFASIQEVLKDPRCGPGHQLVLGIDFPQCWDGKNLDSSNHRSHMANPENGACPSSHPVALPVITYNIRFTIPEGNTHAWHLSSDMYDYAALGGGRSAHADWWDGWDQDIMKAWITNCDQASKDCHGYLLGDGRTLY
jgi:hypothetical protein